MKGRCPRPLDDGGLRGFAKKSIYKLVLAVNQAIYASTAVQAQQGCPVCQPVLVPDKFLACGSHLHSLDMENRVARNCYISSIALATWIAYLTEMHYHLGAMATTNVIATIAAVATSIFPPNLACRCP